MADTDKLAAADTRTPEEIEIHRLKAELNMLWHAGIIEVAVRNRSVADYMEHWEGRALKAEATITALEAENKRLREALEQFAAIADLVDSETEGFSDTDEFQLLFHDFLMASWSLSTFRRARNISRNRRER